MISLLRTMYVLKNSKTPLRAREIGLRADPISAHNTVIRNIFFLRSEYGEDVIKDDYGTGARDSREKSYWFNRNYKIINYYSKYVTVENREKLNEIIISDNIKINIPSTREVCVNIKKKIEASKISLGEMMIVSDFFQQQNKSEAEKIVEELTTYKICSDTTAIDGTRFHEHPFSYVPSALMKRIDHVYINQLSRELS